MRLSPLLVVTAVLATSAGAGILVVACADSDGTWAADAAAPTAQDAPTGARLDAPIVPPVGTEVPMTAPSGPTTESTLASHANSELEALCTLTRACCQAAGQANFEMAKCRAAYQGYGFQGDLLGVSASVVRNGHVTFDAPRGAQCYAGIRALGCRDISAAAYASTANACFTALQGTLPHKAECRATVECQTGLHCGSAPEGPSAGRCVPIKAVGESCEADGECGYRLNGNACDPASKKCVGLLPLGSACRLSGQCASKVCAGTCLAKLENFIRPEECQTFQ
jgi:hypothetical protein